MGKDENHGEERMAGMHVEERGADYFALRRGTRQK